MHVQCASSYFKCSLLLTIIKPNTVFGCNHNAAIAGNRIFFRLSYHQNLILPILTGTFAVGLLGLWNVMESLKIRVSSH